MLNTTNYSIRNKCCDSWENRLLFRKYSGKVGFPGGSYGKDSACNAGDLGFFLGLGIPPGGGHGNPLQYSCLENFPWTEEPGGVQSMGLQRVGHD